MTNKTPKENQTDEAFKKWVKKEKMKKKIKKKKLTLKQEDEIRWKGDVY